MHEIIVNLHMHTPYSDGHYSYQQIAAAAAKTGVDVVIVTDHNVWVKGPERYYTHAGKDVLVLVGEEIHDQARQPQKNHLLVFGADRELATYAGDLQKLVDAVRRAHGLSFIAHPVDPAAPAVHEDDISWENWEVQGYTGLELWNGFSEYKSLIKSKLHAYTYAFLPWLIPHGPLKQTLSRWDTLLAGGRPVVAIGGSDAHALPYRLGPIRKAIFPYEYHFRCINTHVLLTQPLQRQLAEDRRQILSALSSGRAYIGNDRPASTRGFQFSAQGRDQSAEMGETIAIAEGITFKIRLPFATECRLLRNGRVLKIWKRRNPITFMANEPGVYRVEAYIQYFGARRGWIFSNPIFLK